MRQQANTNLSTHASIHDNIRDAVYLQLAIEFENGEEPVHLRKGATSGRCC